jgi:hypothetical protein
MQSRWLNLFACSRSCSKKRCRSKTHHSSHRVILTTERKSTGCHRCWQECALREGFHARRARCRRSHHVRKSKEWSLMEAMWTRFTADARCYAKCFMRRKLLVMCSASFVILALIWILPLYCRSTGIRTLLLGLEVCSILGSTP